MGEKARPKCDGVGEMSERLPATHALWVSVAATVEAATIVDRSSQDRCGRRGRDLETARCGNATSSSSCYAILCYIKN